MNKQIVNIAITGGPCGGKTTALSELTKFLRSLGYTVYLVSEAATRLINDGIRPFGDNKLTIKEFQSLIFEDQYASEEIRRKAALLCPNLKVAILYDRGLMDNQAYAGKDGFNEILLEHNTSEAEILPRYDIVVHLVTAAIGQKKYYTTLNNSARTETADEAVKQDMETMKAWQNHPNLVIVDNSTLFDEKILRTINPIASFLGEKEIIKQERYLVNRNNINLDMFNYHTTKEMIEEFVLSYNNEESELYSKSTINGSNFYTCTRKNHYTNTRTSKIITKEQYDSYKELLKGEVLNKTRYNFIDDGERFRLDLFSINNESFTILERDVSNINRKSQPSFITQYNDITNNRDYDDDSIFTDYNINNIYKKNMI